jgi:hypothetical protein
VDEFGDDVVRAVGGDVDAGTGQQQRCCGRDKAAVHEHQACGLEYRFDGRRATVEFIVAGAHHRRAVDGDGERAGPRGTAAALAAGRIVAVVASSGVTYSKISVVGPVPTRSPTGITSSDRITIALAEIRSPSSGRKLRRTGLASTT